MLTAEQKNSIEQAAERAYKRHVSDLLAATEWVKKLDPAKPNAVGELYEGFLRDTHTAIKKYEEELVSEVVRVTSRVAPALSKSDVEQLRSCCAKFTERSLYEQRMQLFREALDRQASKYGISIDYKATRFDLYQARYSAGTANQVRDTSHRLKQELDILALSREAAAAKTTPETGSSTFGEAINLRPGMFGIRIDLKKVWRWWRNKSK